MIFNVNEGANATVHKSSYELNMNGTLMLVAENEHNYNMIMQSAGLSELKYYQETGKSLFVNEAGALHGFIDKMIALFKTIKEKIIALFNKFKAVIAQYVASDKKFVSMYKDKLKNVKLDSFNGYEFSANLDKPDKVINTEFASDKALAVPASYEEFDSTDVPDKYCDQCRAKIAGESGAMNTDEFRKALKGKFYGGNGGDKRTLTNIAVNKWIGYIESKDKDIRTAQNMNNKICKDIDIYIKNLQGVKAGIDIKADDADDVKKNKEAAAKAIDKSCNNYKEISNSYTIAFGVLIDALKKRNRQAKAICVKALSSGTAGKKKAAKGATEEDELAGTTAANSDLEENAVADIFANVTIV